MADQKTKPTQKSVTAFVNAVDSERKRADSKTLIQLMSKVTGHKPKMWGPSIIGFGKYHYRYETGHEGDWPLTGFSPRKSAISLYIMSGFSKYPDLMKKLGKHKTGKSCLYINKLEDVDMRVLERLIRESVKFVKKNSVR